MVVWQFEITEPGKADFENLDAPTRRRVLQRLKWFMENFNNITPLPLGGEWRGFFKLRVGDWRIVYKPNYESYRIVVHRIDLRDKVYRRKK
ncbi:MAG TPA: type II toxin-antitoxin system RelE/ParE family toxin [Candidatus Paceibacterota bacterium]